MGEKLRQIGTQKDISKVEAMVAKKDYKEKERIREKSAIPEGVRKINGSYYKREKIFETRGEAERESNTSKGRGYFTHVEKAKGGWALWIFDPHNPIRI